MKCNGISLFIYLLVTSSWNTALISRVNKIVLDMNEEGAIVPSSLFGFVISYTVIIKDNPKFTTAHDNPLEEKFK